MTGFELADAFGAVRPVAVLDVAGQRPGEGVPVDVVGVVDDELCDREEVALDGVEVAGVGRGGNQLDLVGGGEGADVRCPVGREVVLDPVIRRRAGIAVRICARNARLSLPRRRGRSRIRRRSSWTS